MEIEALRNTCRPSTTRRRSPFAVAKPTNSACSTSIREERRLRSRIALSDSARVSAGKNR